MPVDEERRRAAARHVQLAWLRALSRRLLATYDELRRIGECVVCGVECVSCVRCSNNHACCPSCHDQMRTDARCPLCREPRGLHCGTRADLRGLLQHSQFKPVCCDCGKACRADEYWLHCAWCPKHEFPCPIHDGCHHHVPAHLLAHHAQHVHGVRVVPVDRPVVVAIGKGETLFAVVGGVLVVVSTDERHAHSAFGAVSHGMPLFMRGYYPSPASSSLHCVLRHYSLSSFASDRLQHEDFAYGPIPPVLGSQERSVVMNRVPILSGFCYQREARAGPIVHRWSDATETILQSLRRHGVRDVATMVDAFGATPINMERRLALLTLEFAAKPPLAGSLG